MSIFCDCVADKPDAPNFVYHEATGMRAVLAILHQHEGSTWSARVTFCCEHYAEEVLLKLEGYHVTKNTPLGAWLELSDNLWRKHQLIVLPRDKATALTLVR